MNRMTFLNLMNIRISAKTIRQVTTIMELVAFIGMPKSLCAMNMVKGTRPILIARLKTIRSSHSICPLPQKTNDQAKPGRNNNRTAPSTARAISIKPILVLHLSHFNV